MRQQYAVRLRTCGDWMEDQQLLFLDACSLLCHQAILTIQQCHMDRGDGHGCHLYQQRNTRTSNVDHGE